MMMIPPNQRSCPVCKRVRYLCSYRLGNHKVRVCGKTCLNTAVAILSRKTKIAHSLDDAVYIRETSQQDAFPLQPQQSSNRTLPHVHPQARSSFKDRGFVSENFSDGLSPTSMWHHAASGRVGIIDTAQKTAPTGYTSRRLVKAMENHVVDHIHSTRDENGQLIQILYGEDGRDAATLLEQPVELYKASANEITAGYDKSLHAYVLLMKYQLETMLPHRETNKWPLAVRADLLLSTCAKKDSSTDPIDPRVAGSMLHQLLVELGEDQLVIHLYLVGHFLKRKVLLAHDVASYNRLLDAVRWQWQKAEAPAGECVGVIAAQSISEPLLQSTLNSFHFAGMECKTSTTGVPRLQELINCSKGARRPSMTIYPASLEACTEVEREVALTALITSLTEIKLADICCSINLYRDLPASQQSMLVRNLESRCVSSMRDSLILELDMEQCEARNLDYGELAHRLTSEFCSLKFRAALKGESVILIAQPPSLNDPEPSLLRKMRSAVSNCVVRGIPGILKCYRTKSIAGWCIETDGVNVDLVSELDTVDHHKTITNIPPLNESTHGVEMGYASMLLEMRLVMENDSLNVNTRHLMLAAATMSHKGRLEAISRHGVMARKERGVLDRSTFEVPDTILIDAAARQLKDSVSGVSARCALNQRYKFGSSYQDILLDCNMIKPQF